eukprot:PRCOL_00005311-RA
MNARAAYVKSLRRWARELGVGARLLWRAGGARRPAGAEGVMLCLCAADAGALGAFCTRLRTEYVDVDARGNKCRERQSTTLCMRGPGDVKPGEEASLEFGGFEEVEYVEEAEMEEALRGLNLLHVGSGAGQRFSSCGSVRGRRG